MSTRFVKKSVVSCPTRSVRTPYDDPWVGRAEDPQPADEDGHLRGADAEQVGLVDESELRGEVAALAG